MPISTPLPFAGRPPRILLATFGTHGDIFPFLGVAERLRELGCEPVVATSRHYEALIRERGVEFAKVDPQFEDVQRETGMGLKELMAMAQHPLHGPRLALEKILMPSFSATFEDTLAAARGADMVISHAYSFAAPLAARALGIPWRSLALQPLAFLSASDPSRLALGLPLHALQPLIGERLYGRLLGAVKRRSRRWLKPVDAMAKSLGLEPGPHPIFENFPPHGSCALFPRWMMRPGVISDLPEGLLFAGFSRFDGGSEPLSDELERFLSQGAPPIVFTLGSSVVMNPGRFYDEAAAACSRLGARAIFLRGSSVSEAVDAPGQLSVNWASHARLFPRARLVAHQGGMGTSAQACLAGVPQLVVPHANDQPDNAERLAKAGLARWIAPKKFSKDRAFRELSEALADSEMARRCSEMGAKLRSEPDGSIKAAAWIASAARAGSPSSD